MTIILEKKYKFESYSYCDYVEFTKQTTNTKTVETTENQINLTYF